MDGFNIALFVSSVIAGVLMFLAPCTLPLVPAYLAFIAGVKPGQPIDTSVRRAIIHNSLSYIAGFSLVFVGLGVLAGFSGAYLGALRTVLVPLVGVLICLFGLQMLHVITPRRMFANLHVTPPAFLTPGSSVNAFTVGIGFALGWTPCVGPLLATILLLAGSSGTVVTGMLLLTAFALGLGLPFFITALLYAEATRFITAHQYVVRYTEVIGGIFLILIGVLLLTNNFELTVTYGYKLLEFFGIGDLLDYY